MFTLKLPEETFNGINMYLIYFHFLPCKKKRKASTNSGTPGQHIHLGGGGVLCVPIHTDRSPGESPSVEIAIAFPSVEIAFKIEQYLRWNGYK